MRYRLVATWAGYSQINEAHTIVGMLSGVGQTEEHRWHSSPTHHKHKIAHYKGIQCSGILLNAEAIKPYNRLCKDHAGEHVAKKHLVAHL